jgi:hypothetical protein
MGGYVRGEVSNNFICIGFAAFHEIVACVFGELPKLFECLQIEAQDCLTR